MAPTIFLFFLSFLWVTYHLLYARDHPSTDEDSRTRWTVRSNALGISISTTLFNGLPSKLLRKLNGPARRKISYVYDVGILWGVFGMVLGMGLLVFQAWGIIGSLWKVVEGDPTGVVKRGLKPRDGGNEGLIKPLVRSLLSILSFFS